MVMATARRTSRVGPSAPITVAVVALAVVVALLTTACGSSSKSSSTTTATATPLEGTAWKLTTGGGMGVDLNPAGVTARFEAGTMSGNAGCNSYTAPYKLAGSTLVVGPNIAATAKACAGQEAAVEAAYLTILPKVAAFSITGTTLTLNDKDLKPLLIYEASV
jgi:heat shock protein HslJ